MTKLKENLIAFVGAIILTSIVILLVNYKSNNLTTDVLGLKRIDVQKDLKLVTMATGLELVSYKNIPNVASLTLELMFDYNKLNLTENHIKSNYDLALQKISTGNYYIMLTNINSIKQGDVLLKITNITNTGDVNINFGHIQVIDNNGNIVNLILSE